MLNTLIKLGKREGLHRIGLTVVANNRQAIHLYKRFGFKIEGVMKDAYLGEDGRNHDELVMGLIFDQEDSV